MLRPFYLEVNSTARILLMRRLNARARFVSP